jgi:hypothetical protein
MSWLKEHVYLAAWLALPITVLVAFIQNKKAETKAESFPLKKSLMYLLFLICFPIALTPWVEFGVRFFCGVASILLFLLIVYTPDKDWAQ